MISSDSALKIVLDHALTLGTEYVQITKASGRCLATIVKSDRDFPPFHRVSMDGIAIKYNAYKTGARAFTIQGTQFAGAKAQTLKSEANCIEIMTGGVLPKNCDTVIPYEHISIENGEAKINRTVKKGQNVHHKGLDRKKGDTLIENKREIRASEIATLATVGIGKVKVVKNPAVAVISTGNELVAINKTPKEFQIRSSNAHTLHSMLSEFKIDADMLHIRDTEKELKKKIALALKKYDLILFSGGVSKGKADYVPSVLESLGVKKLFHQVSQRPGKPFWFGRKGKKVIFAFPGNPVSCFTGFLKYCRPFLYKSYGIDNQGKIYAELSNNFNFKPKLTYFLQVKQIPSKQAKCLVKAVVGHGSGDLANLLHADGLLELPANKSEFKKGESYPYYSYRRIV